ncbi:TPA: type VI secretion system contractile sheath small subunit [Pseudomonas aeruginosa]|uniref:type VI secretion system contractile sheath small subunit n=1 Tax=Pseudomonas aeruginosa TaxID=287 RepID=UPI001F420CC3|nr:type VI secretion system contractile sheath small subunit [Pseudomonas aeruginosa]MDG3713987.1 type VI secretion system contractile sheath small subunit [Pseudomonas aeruginosa]HBO3623972.1 type VI secretion system contractile sheath small subunit [Pseudomonas aeruginosa]
MAKKAGTVAPKERINITYVPATGDQQAEVELPLKLLVVGNFKGHEEETAIEDRPIVDVDRNNFNDVLGAMGISLKTSVPMRLGDAKPDDTLSVELDFKHIKDFGPDAVVQQVPELRRLLELRDALVAVKGPMGNVPAFRKQLQALLGDEASRNKLAKELSQALENSSS